MSSSLPEKLSSLRVVIPFLPPSANNMYVNVRNGGRRLSDDAKTFQRRFSQEVLPNYLPSISRFDTNGIFSVHVMLFFPTNELINKSYGTGKKDAAKNRYKKMDVGNRSKLIVDCLVKALTDGVFDDSLFFRETLDKYDCKLVGGVPQTVIELSKTTPEVFGV